MFLINRTSIFNNPAYITRRGLFRSVRENSSWIEGKTLDFGCGTKPYKSLFRKVTSYIGVEYDTGQHTETKTGSDFFYDGKTLPFEDQTFDSFFSSEVFEHVFNLEEILPEINRVLKPGAHFMITCPFVWPEHEAPYDYARYTSYGLLHLLEKNGFEKINFIKTSNFTESILQLCALYIHFFIPKKIKIVYRIGFVLFVTPVFVFSNLLNLILPRQMKRYDLYLNNMVIARKKP
jgi:SAM-dependent methyltransferase